MVGGGIIWEAWRAGHLWELPTACVFFGVIIEAVATIFLFEFDEGISRAQQSVIESQNQTIIALESPRVPDPKKFLGAIQGARGVLRVEILYVKECGDCQWFASFLEGDFKQAHWEVIGASPIPPMSSSDPDFALYKGLPVAESVGGMPFGVTVIGQNPDDEYSPFNAA